MAYPTLTMRTIFSDLEVATKGLVTRRYRVLNEIGAVLPLLALIAEIDPLYPKGEGRVCPRSVFIECCASTVVNDALVCPPNPLIVRYTTTRRFADSLG